MANRQVKPISLPPLLLKKVEEFAKREHLTFSELARAALRDYMENVQARRAAWKRASTYGKKRAREMGIRTEEDVYRLMEELRHGDPHPTHAAARRR